ncbi:MAG: hypothetical protein AB9869_34585 [Verrucomicrobiia bacterium]
MKNRVLRSVALAVLVIMGAPCVLVFSGCGGKPPEAETNTVSFQHLPEATKVLALLETKDYNGAVTSWVNLRESVTTEEQQADYTALSRVVREKLFEAANTDPNAGEALQVYRAITSGR